MAMIGAQVLSIGWGGPAELLGGLAKALSASRFRPSPEVSGPVEAHHSYAVYSGALGPAEFKSLKRPS